jgi:hypothetical protein
MDEHARDRSVALQACGALMAVALELPRARREHITRLAQGFIRELTADPPDEGAQQAGRPGR